jgi:hypothetical protein
MWPVRQPQPIVPAASPERLGWMLFFTGVLAGTAIVSAVVSALQWTELRESGAQVERSIAAANRQADAAAAQAAAAAEAVRVAEVSQRPYIFVNPAGAFNIKAGGSPLQAYILIGNSGQTFAQNVERSVGILVSSPTEPADIAPLLARQPGRTFVSPRADTVMIAKGQVLTAEHVTKLMEGELRVYVFGRITYQYGNGNRRRLLFCHAYYGSEMENDRRESYLGWQSQPCERHNEPD